MIARAERGGVSVHYRPQTELWPRERVGLRCESDARYGEITLSAEQKNTNEAAQMCTTEQKGGQLGSNTEFRTRMRPHKGGFEASLLTRMQMVVDQSTTISFLSKGMSK